ncbi:DUF6691 family protein [Haliea sp. E17]|uniref:DUF6691 family protein n=1 Tax=Haliea sp. E17 TaxID=3401576 RepID=UPI003AABD86D
MHPLPQLIVALLAGVLMGLGLSVAQMIDPAKVVNFLDVFGTWDPSLAFVMGGGLAVNGLATWFILKQPKPAFAQHFQLPPLTAVDPRIVLGGAVFGIGWGLAGYCPGPMIVSLSFADSAIVTVVGSYLVGTFVTRWWLSKAS